jgi:transposase InsO family protein
MSLARSTYYQRSESAAVSARRSRDAALLAVIEAVAAESPAYGYRRITHELRRRGTVVNHKRVARLMREGAVTPKRVRRFLATTDSAHDSPIFPNLAARLTVTGPNQLWVADLTYIRLRTRFVYLAVLLDAWSRKVVGYAISHLSIRGCRSPRSKPRSRTAGRPPGLCTIRIEGSSTPPAPTGSNSPHTAFAGRCHAQGTRTTTPMSRAS